MGTTTHKFVVANARRVAHPINPEIEKHWFTVPASEFPAGISTGANARDPEGLNRAVYREVRDNLYGQSSPTGIFDLMNKGITILADSVTLLDKAKNIYEVVVNDDHGIVDGAHTARIIEEANREGKTDPRQYVEVYIRTGFPDDYIAEIAKGLNTGIQVKRHSIYDIDGVFDWLKDEIKAEAYANMIAWGESDAGEYDVRDIVGVLELFNVFEFPNDKPRHPISAYEKWSIPLERFAADYQQASKGGESIYLRLRPLLRDALKLYDIIRRDFYSIHNGTGGSAGKLKIVEAYRGKVGKGFQFVFAGLDSEPYRLSKGATFPILGAFRNCVQVDPVTQMAQWRGGFSSVLKLWEEAGPELVAETFQASREAPQPDALGKSRGHWGKLHMQLQNRLLRQQLEKLSNN